MAGLPRKGPAARSKSASGNGACPLALQAISSTRPSEATATACTVPATTVISSKGISSPIFDTLLQVTFPQSVERFAGEMQASCTREERLCDDIAALIRKQREVGRKLADLERAGIDLETVKDRGHASKLMDLIVTRGNAGLATFKQIRILEKLGYPNARTASRTAANAFLDARLPKRKAA